MGSIDSSSLTTWKKLVLLIAALLVIVPALVWFVNSPSISTLGDLIRRQPLQCPKPLILVKPAEKNVTTPAKQQQQKLYYEDPCHYYKFLFVLGTGRSGTTTIKAFLNSLPHFRIAGENKDVLGRLLTIFNSLKEIKGWSDGAGAWENRYDLQKMFDNSRKYILDTIAPGPEDKVIGFKEIRENSLDKVRFLKQLFPCSKIILSYRNNTEEQSHSAFYKNHQAATTELEDANNFMFKLHNANPSWMYLLALEDFSIEKFDDLLQWVGEKGCHANYIPQMNANSTYQNDRNWRNATRCDGEH